METTEPAFSKSHKRSLYWPVVVEPVDDSVGFEVELGGQHLDGVLGGVGLQEVGLPQGFFLLSSQHYPRLLHLAVRAQVQRGQGRTYTLRTSAG